MEEEWIFHIFYQLCGREIKRRTLVDGTNVSSLLSSTSSSSSSDNDNDDEKKKLKIVLQPSPSRIYSDDEFIKVGAEINEDLSEADLILGVKQVKIDDLLPNKSYMFFSHVIKGQHENMPLLQSILDKKIRLFDYECIVEAPSPSSSSSTSNEKKGGGGRRLVTFGKYAGIAGTIDILQALGQRLLAEGYSTPFLNSPPAYMYYDLDDAKKGVSRVGDEIATKGLPSDLEPIVFGFTGGSGNVANGALEMFRLLPHEMITVEELRDLKKDGKAGGGGGGSLSRKVVYGVIIPQEELVRRRRRQSTSSSSPDDDDSPSKFDVQHYRKHPHEYDGVFHETIAPYIDVLVNGIYWDERYPRLLTKKQIHDLYAANRKSLRCIADISCDVNGSIEFLDRTTTIDHQFFQYDPLTGETSEDGIGEEGVVVLGVDILPTEIARESSKHFGDALVPLLKGFLRQDAAEAEATLPKELVNACVTSEDGKLTPHFRYIETLKDRALNSLKNKAAAAIAGGAPSVFVQLEGHLFDSGLINQVLNVIENLDCHFEIMECTVRPKTNDRACKSTVLIRISSDDRERLRELTGKIETLVDLIATANATIHCYDNKHQQRQKSSSSSSSPAASNTPGGSTTTTTTSSGQFTTTYLPPQPKDQRILILGAGRVAASASSYLGRSQHNHITVASAIEAEAHEVARHAKRGSGVTLDASNDPKKLSELVQSSDIVISLLPAHMHASIARHHCLPRRTNLVTASYASDEMRSLHDSCVDENVTVLTECGLDPGMDHMSAMRIVDDVRLRGGRVSSFASVCGGLPAPEAANNPLKYKFSWSPMGVLTASRNDAIYRSDGERVVVDGEDLLRSAAPYYDDEGDVVWPGLRLECLPNRNSLSYESIYGIEDAATVFRGTLRYSGFSKMLYALGRMGLFDDVVVSASSTSELCWPIVIAHCCRERGYGDDISAFLLDCCSGNVEDAKKVGDCLRWLGVFDNDELFVTYPDSMLKSFCDVLERKLSFGDDERDMILMHHTIEALFDENDNGSGKRRRRRKETHHSSLQLFGDNEMSAMCKTVGYTAAIAADEILKGTITRKGVILPTTKDVYEPCLSALREEGVTFEERVFVEDEGETTTKEETDDDHHLSHGNGASRQNKARN